MNWLRVMAALGVFTAAASAGAQAPARVMGRVVDKASRAAVANAEIILSPGSIRVSSDSSGTFRFDSVAPGRVGILVRHFGFRPESVLFAVQATEDFELMVELERTAQQLDTVSVEAAEIPLAERKLAAFHERRKFGTGRFFDSQTLEKEKNRKLGEFITSRTSGSKLVRSRMGSAAWVATTRISGGFALGGGVPLEDSDRAAGADPRACYPDVYVDGALIYASGSRGLLFDINSYSTNDVMAVEFYVSASQVPIQFNKTGAACGVLVLWTK
ncbi:MAG: carboxypeptidase regulatory-like domain-containing protein [Gemmatimonadota bacterium]